MKQFLFLMFWLITVMSYAQTVNTFQKFYGGGGYDDGREIIEVENGSFVIVGSTENFGAQSSDILVFKIDSLGNVLWRKTFGTFGVDRGIAIRKINSGFAILAQTNGKGNGGYDFNFIKTDSIGNILLDKTYGGVDWDIATSFVMAYDSSFVLAGYSNSFGKGTNESYFIKINLQGDTIWTKHYGGSHDESINSITQANDSNFYATGQTNNLGDTLGDISLFKLDALGNIIWKKNYGGGYNDLGNSICKSIDGNLLLAVQDKISDTATYAYGYKVDTSGVVIWVLEASNPIFANFLWVSQGKNGDCLFTGKYTSFWQDSTAYFGSGGLDYFFASVNNNGVYISTKLIGFSGNDYGTCIIECKYGGVIFCGNSNSFGNGLDDILIRKSYQNGDCQFPNKYFTDITLNVNEKKLDNHPKIFPNPASGKLYFTESNAKNIRIINLLGEVVLKNTQLNKEYNSIEINSLLSGIYFVEYSYINAIVVHKIIIE